MRFVVTGAAGFIGSHLASALRAAGRKVVGVDSFTDYYDPALKEENAAELDVRRLDLAGDDLAPVLEGADGIFHLAGQPGVRASFDDFPAYLSRNLLATQRVFEAAAARKIRVVFASSSSVYGDAERLPTPEDVVPAPISPYGITKLACENLIRAYERGRGLDAVTLRYFTVYGPRQRPDMAFAQIFGALRDGRPFPLYGDGAATRGFTYVADVVAATITAMNRASAGAVYNVGGGTEVSMLEAIRTCEQISGRALRLQALPAEDGDPRRTAADTSRIRSDLDWEPWVDLEEGLAAQWEWASSRVAVR